MSKIQAKVLKGFRDLLPSESIIKERFLTVIKSVFEKYGFSPIHTPALEYLEILSGKGGDENEKLMYKFQDNGGRDVGLRYDLTVPLARFIGSNKNDLNFPFKRYHIAPVWRAENPQKGRYREFYQCDCDIVGSDSYMADAEILFLIHDTLKALKIDDFKIRINSRVFIDGLFNILNLPESDKNKLSILIDKMEKMPRDKFEKEYSEILKDEKQHKIFSEFVFEIKNIDQTDSFFKNHSNDEKLFEYIERFKNILNASDSIKQHIDFTPYIIRGLDYYTGIVYETILTDSPEFGAIFSGGRYDGLIGMFSKESIPAVGASIGISRLISALTERGFFDENRQTVSDVLVINLDENLSQEYFKLAHTLRNNEINCDVYYDNAKMKKQFKHADKMKYKLAVIMGSDEFNNNSVKLKNLTNFTEENVKIPNLVEAIKKIIG